MLLNILLTFLDLLRLGIVHAENPNIFSRENDNWISIKALSDRQGFTAVLLDGLLQLPKRNLPPEEIVLLLTGKSWNIFRVEISIYGSLVNKLMPIRNLALGSIFMVQVPRVIEATTSILYLIGRALR